MNDEDGVYIPGLGVFRYTRDIKISERLDRWKNSPEFTEIMKYPEYARWLAGHIYDSTITQNPMSRDEIAIRAAEFGVPKSVLGRLFGGGGGGAGVNRADEIRSISATILNRSTALGMNLTPEEIDYLANVAQDQSYSSEQLDNVLVGMVDWKTLSAGSLTAGKEEVDALARSYLIGMSDDTSRQWAEKLAKGQATPASVESYLRTQAKVMNPWLADYIDQGLTPSELLQSSRDLIAKNLEIDSSTVDFMQDRFMSLATITDDSGNTRLATQGELMRNVRKDSAWANTQQAKSSVTGMAQIIASIFGRSSF